ncbi:MAG: hypothetical protein B6D63_04580 [Candidatus Latescibacteria bacterium 4484_7]|nr:MAG: hypothetical protein B6D63_04580 [Candidatus Latescibacteria bacterium 4484_7]
MMKINKFLILTLIVLNGSCSPAPKYFGHGSKPKRKDRVDKKRIENIEKIEISLMPPVKGFSRNRITSFFGLRKDPKYETEEFHKGIDINAKRGDYVFASADGTVEFSGRQRGYGHVIIINHGNRIRTVYAHLEIDLVSPGDEVKKGDKIGRVGDSGRATSCHLHFELREAEKALDPLKYLDVKSEDVSNEE